MMGSRGKKRKWAFFMKSAPNLGALDPREFKGSCQPVLRGY